MNKRCIVGAAGVLLSLSGCATTYQPLKVDEKTALYPTSTQVDPGGVQAFVTTANPRSFPVVLLLTESNYRPANFSFMVRDALAQVGITTVYTADEFRSMAHDQKFDTPESVDSETIKRYSQSVAAVLVVSASHMNVGDANTMTTLTIQDGRSGQTLLKLSCPRFA